MNNKYTPATINNLSFSIPLYQRLFEWNDKEIKQLLTDLFNSYKIDKSTPYYIGMLTVHKDNDKQSLVDGQQRFTVLNLMGIAFKNEKWSQFVKPNNEDYRLNFFARAKDASYIKKIFENISDNVNENYVNKKMENAIKTIEEFIESIDSKHTKEDFIEYIYNNATFFISELPEEYTPQDLNRYFEAMNASGKGLENYEILKVDLLKKLTHNKVLYTKIWNAVSEMDKCLIRPFNKEETTEKFRSRVQNSLAKISDYKEISKECKDIINDNTTDENFENDNCIKNIKSNSKRPSVSYHTRSERSILNFTEFLLQVLWLQLSQEDRNNSINFFNTYKLQETFKKHLKDNEVETFFNNLLKYRILFDNFIIRITQSEQTDNSYFINFNDEKAEPEIRKQVIQYQSMLYVSTSSHLWLTKLLEFIEEKPREVIANNFITKIKEYDNKRWNGKLDSSKLKYGSIDRYWFWRLDYYLWEKRETLYDERSHEIANNYLFKANRSIEHIAPQTPQTNSAIDLDEMTLDRFGNLAMISSGQNSSLQNESFEIKRAHVKSFIDKHKNGSIESLKMLNIYNYDTWNIDKIEEHEEEMITILQGSFS